MNKSNRELALEWWKSLSTSQQVKDASNYFFYTRSIESITGREIEDMFNKDKSISKNI